MVRLAQLLIVLSVAAMLCAQEYQPWLIPIAADETRGAFGTVWNTKVTVVNEQSVETEPIGFIFTFVPPGIARSQPRDLAVPGSVGEPPGTIVYVRSDAADSVHMTASVRERGSADAVQIPVARGDAFANRTGYFLDLIRKPATRLTLRVYSLDLAAADPAVRVRVQANVPPYLRPWEFVYDQPHALSVRQRTMSNFEGSVTLPVRPLALELGLDALLSNVPEGAELAISVVPLGDLRVWSMLSETDSTTQRVTLRYVD